MEEIIPTQETFISKAKRREHCLFKELKTIWQTQRVQGEGCRG